MKYLIENTSNSPNVAFWCIKLSFKNLNWHVKWSSYWAFDFNFSMNILFSKSKIGNFNFSFLNQNVCWFNVSITKIFIYLWTVPSRTRAKKPLQISVKIDLAVASFKILLVWVFKNFSRSLSQSYCTI